MILGRRESALVVSGCAVVVNSITLNTMSTLDTMSSRQERPQRMLAGRDQNRALL